jgi:hypothetical protein
MGDGADRGLTDAAMQKKLKIAMKLNKLEPIKRGKVGNFFNCKKMKVSTTGKNFKEEYVMLKKRSRSVEAKKILKL